MGGKGMQHHRPATQKTNGFTLIELLVVLTLVGVILAIAAPSFMNIIASNRVASAANEIITVLNLGKNEAIRSGENVVLCKRATNDSCDTANTGDWSNGWVLFQDTNDNQSVNDGERIIRVQSDIETSLDLAYKGNYGVKNLIFFKPNGSLGSKGHFCLRNNQDDTKSRAVVIHDLGRFRIDEQAYDCS
jgi:type IV fimbrial biogenesis protein FimT